MKRFEEIKNEFENTGKYMNTVGYNAIGDLIQMIDLLIKRNSIENGNLKELCNSQKRKIKELEEKELMNRKMNELAETQILSYAQGYRDGINKETTACSIIAREREIQIIYEGMKHKINNEWRFKIKEMLSELDKNEHERINKIKNPNEMFPNLIYISNKKILKQLLKEGEENV